MSEEVTCNSCGATYHQEAEHVCLALLARAADQVQWSTPQQVKSGTIHAEHEGWMLPVDGKLKCSCGEVLLDLEPSKGKEQT